MGERKYPFGENWQDYVQRYLTQERVEEAKESLSHFLAGCGVKGKSFIDVGCGSGLFSLAAYQLGASRILSFDADPACVKCCATLREREGSPAIWRVAAGSILDETFLAGVDKHDVVYSWGVLHHTGKMWQALENAAGLVADGGLLYVAIYNRADCFAVYPDYRFGSSRFWGWEKRAYSRFPRTIQHLIDYSVMGALVLGYLATFNNPFKKIRGPGQYRGMAWRTRVKDWLGGYPYDCAPVDEVFRFVRGLGFSLENLRSDGGLGNNEYLFRKRMPERRAG